MVHVITGGAGFLGCRLARELMDDGRHVVLVDDLSAGHVRNVERAVSNGATFVFVDASAPFAEFEAALDRALRGRRIVRLYRLGGRVAGAAGTSSLVRVASKHRARFLYASSDAQYGRSEEAAVLAARGDGLDVRIARLFGCYGPAMDDHDRFLSGLFEAAAAGRPFPLHGDGTRTRPMTYVSDAVWTIRAIVEDARAGPGPFDVGSDLTYTEDAIARTVADTAGVPYASSRLPGGDEPAPAGPDLRESIAYHPVRPTALADGLRETYGWLRDHRPVFA